jgi:outer membrane protein assembly factor BamB
VADNLVLFADAAGIHAAHLATGKPAIAADGLIYRNEATLQEQQIPSLRNFGIRGIAGSGVSHGVPRLTLTVVDRIAYGRVGAPVTSRSDATTTAADDRIIGLDLRREGLLTLRLRPDDTAWSFDGTPVSDGRRIFVAMRHDGVTPGAYVACFDATTGSQLWRTSIGSADTPAAGRGEEITHHLLTLVGDRIYFNTSLGLVAALDAANGQICWLAKYPRLTGRPFTLGDYPLHFDRDPSPGLYHDGLVVVAPADSPDIFALDAESGKTIWTNTELPDALHLLGAVGQNLIVSGNRLSVLDARSGTIRWTWPESTNAGVRGMGRGVVAGNEVFWPTRTDVYALQIESGARTRSPISLSPVSDCGANLAIAGGRLIAAGYDKLLAFGPPTPAPNVNPAQVPSTPARTGRLSDRSKAGR